MFKVIYNFKFLGILIFTIVLLNPYCQRINREEKFGEKQKSLDTLPEKRKENESLLKLLKENSDLKAQIKEMQDIQSRSDSRLNENMKTLCEITKGLNDINTNYINLYNDVESEPSKINNVKADILKRIEDIKMVIENNHKLVQKLKISPEIIEKHGRIVEELKDQLELQKKEITKLKNDNFTHRWEKLEQKELYLKQKEKTFEQRKINFNLNRNLSSLEEQFKNINKKLHLEEEKGKIKYFLRITPNSFEPIRCTEKIIKLKKEDILITSHPSNSFEWSDKEKRILKILDWENFWMEGKFVIVFNKELTIIEENKKK